MLSTVGASSRAKAGRARFQPRHPCYAKWPRLELPVDWSGKFTLDGNDLQYYVTYNP